MIRMLRTSYVDVPKDKVGPLGLNCVTKVTGNTYFPGAAPYVAAIQAALDDYVPAAAIKNPVPEQTALLAQYRKALNAALAAMARYANTEYPTNEAALLSVGLLQVKERERHTTLDAPTDVRLSDGKEAATVCVEFSRNKYGVATEIRYTDDATLAWPQWLSLTTTKSSALLRGYARKTEVFVMVRSVGGDTDDQPFSEVLSRIVQ